MPNLLDLSDRFAAVYKTSHIFCFLAAKQVSEIRLQRIQDCYAR